MATARPAKARAARAAQSRGRRRLVASRGSEEAFGVVAKRRNRAAPLFPVPRARARARRRAPPRRPLRAERRRERRPRRRPRRAPRRARIGRRGGRVLQPPRRDAARIRRRGRHRGEFRSLAARRGLIEPKTHRRCVPRVDGAVLRHHGRGRRRSRESSGDATIRFFPLAARRVVEPETHISCVPRVDCARCRLHPRHGLGRRRRRCGQSRRHHRSTHVTLRILSLARVKTVFKCTARACWKAARDVAWRPGA